MIDLIFTVASLVFFAIAVAYTAGCERLRGGTPSGGELTGGKLNA